MQKVRVGCLGLGRLGYHHAKNLATKVPGVQLEAVCEYQEEVSREFAEKYNVPKVYTDFEAMCSDPDIDAVALVTPALHHAEQIQIAMDHGKHVFCEKPLATTVENCLKAEKIVESHPELVFMLGFMRRFDDSYAEAKRHVDQGDIGRVVLVRAYTQDPRATIEVNLKFAPYSGGQFLDMCVHDLDLIRWFTGSEVKRVWGIGDVFEFDLYRELNDADNAAATVQLENGAMGFMFTNRTHAAGSNVETEIIGTHGTLRIANIGAKNLLEIVDSHGAHYSYYQDFLSRWQQAFVSELTEFASCILENRKPEITVYDGTAATRAAYACKESFETGELVNVLNR